VILGLFKDLKIREKYHVSLRPTPSLPLVTFDDTVPYTPHTKKLYLVI